MYTATANLVLPTSIIGSLPRPAWYTQNLGARDFPVGHSRQFE